MILEVYLLNVSFTISTLLLNVSFTVSTSLLVNWSLCFKLLISPDRLAALDSSCGSLTHKTSWQLWLSELSLSIFSAKLLTWVRLILRNCYQSTFLLVNWLFLSVIVNFCSCSPGFQSFGAEHGMTQPHTMRVMPISKNMWIKQLCNRMWVVHKLLYFALCYGCTCINDRCHSIATMGQITFI